MESLISATQIGSRVAILGDEITEYYRDLDEPLVVVGVLRGSFVFLADLARQIDLPLYVDFLGASSYGSGTESSGEVRLTTDLRDEIADKHVLLVEDIVDTGQTIGKLRALLNARRPAALKVVTLLDKPSRRTVDQVADWVGFTIEDLFVVGYGLDCAGLDRNLPFIGVRSGA